MKNRIKIVFLAVLIFGSLILVQTQPQVASASTGQTNNEMIQTNSLDQTMDFEGFEGGLNNQYQGVTWSANWITYYGVGGYPARSGVNAAVNNFNSADVPTIYFAVPVSYVSIWFVLNLANLTLNAHDAGSNLIRSKTIYAGAPGTYQQVVISSTTANIASISVDDTHSYGFWVVDDIKLATFIDFHESFEKINTHPNSQIPGLSFTGWFLYTGGGSFAARTGTHDIYPDSTNKITFNHPVNYVRFWWNFNINVGGAYGTATAYDEFGNPIASQTVTYPGVSGIYQKIDLLSNQTIKYIQIYQNTQVGNYGAMTLDDLSASYINAEILDFETSPAIIGSYYPNVSFDSQFYSWDSTANANFPAHSGLKVAYDQSYLSNITFTNEVALVQSYIVLNSQSIKIIAYDVNWNTITSVTINASIAVNQKFFLKSDLPNIKYVQIQTNSTTNTQWSIDDLLFSTGLRAINFPPFFTSVPVNLSISQGDTGYELTWTIQDHEAGNYTVIRNDVDIKNGTYSPGVPIPNVDDLSLLAGGTYVYTIYVSDGIGMTIIDSVTVTVTDTTAPFVSSPLNITYTLGTTGHNIIWNANENGAYSLYINGAFIEEMVYSGGDVVINVDNHTVGMYSYTIIFKDASLNEASDTVWVTVTEEIDIFPPVISSPPDISYVFGTTGHSIVWNASETGAYTIWIDGVWIGDVIYSGGNVVINVDGKPVGMYNYTIEFRDAYLNEASDTVWVTVTEAPDTLPPVISSPPDISYVHGTTGHSIVWNANENGTYSLYIDGGWIEDMAYSGGDVVINVDGKSVGTYNYTISFRDANMNEAMDMVLVTVTAVDTGNTTTTTTTIPPSSTPTPSESASPAPLPLPGMEFLLTIISLISIGHLFKKRHKVIIQ